MVDSAAFRPPAKTPKASDVLANMLRMRILAEGLSPGDSLPAEADLIDEYRFSRGTVREAMRILETEGLIAVRRGAGGGVEVLRPDGSTIAPKLAVMFAFEETPLARLLDFRLICEPPAAAIAAREATAVQRERLLRLAQPNLKDSVDFHRALADATNNDLLRVVLNAVDQLVEWHSSLERLSESAVGDTAVAHQRIAAAVSRGNAKAAEAAMRVHLESFRDMLAKHRRLEAPIIPRPSRNQAGRSELWFE